MYHSNEPIAKLPDPAKSPFSGAGSFATASNTIAWESGSAPSWLRSLSAVILSSCLISLFAKVAIPLPFTPVPLATQGIVILILSVFLGSKRAVAAVLGFLAQAAMGLPVLAGGVGGIAKLAGPTGGYLFGYVAGAFLVGYLAERTKVFSTLKLFSILAAGKALFFVFGVPYLAAFVGLKNAFVMGLLPFILGDLLKLGAAVKLLEWLCDRGQNSREKG